MKIAESTDRIHERMDDNIFVLSDQMVPVLRFLTQSI